MNKEFYMLPDAVGAGSIKQLAIHHHKEAVMHTITIVGLGPGEKRQMPLSVYERLMSSQSIIVRTSDHPALNEMKEEGLVFESMDYLYDQYSKDFSQEIGRAHV